MKCLFKINIPVYGPQAAVNVFQAKSHITLIQFFKIRLDNAAAVVVDTEVEFISMHILGEVDKAGAAVFKIYY